MVCNIYIRVEIVVALNFIHRGGLSTVILGHAFTSRALIIQFFQIFFLLFFVVVVVIIIIIIYALCRHAAPIQCPGE